MATVGASVVSDRSPVALTAGLAGSALLTGIGVTTLYGVRDELPARLAIHWGIIGEANGWADFAGVVRMVLGLGLGGALFTLALGWWLRCVRSCAVVAVVQTALVVAPMTLLVLAQRGGVVLTAGRWGVAIPLALVLLAGATILVARQRHSARAVGDEPKPFGAEILPGVGPDARVAWVGRMHRGPALWVTATVLAASTIPLAAVGIAHHKWPLTLLALVLTVAVGLALTCLVARVTIDARGLRATGAGFISWARLPLDGITGASVVRVEHPLADFGGWGLRGSRSGESALVSAAGRALRVERREATAWLLTVDDPETAAATLNTLVEKRSANARRVAGERSVR
ncbi:hypothetical protein AAEX63_12555 [Luteococcus sp. H138]|uniref:hypothetical protein n=1 Tax=unclassified Luteococcus TaxID=2639923 RepID=UPI00313F0A00